MPSDAQLTGAQRAAAIERTGENLALRSGAGCGKTFVLARRFVELLRSRAEADNPLSRLVALTFTEKAAMEMSARVRAMLAEAAAGARGPRRATLQRWLDELPEARISTIHGFCAGLLRSRAVEAGIDPNFAVCADELLAEQMVSEAVEQAVLAAVEAERADAAELLAGLSFNQVASLVGLLVGRRTDCDLPACADADATFAKWQELLEAGRGEWLAELAEDAEIRQELKSLARWPCGHQTDRLALFCQEQLGIIRAILADPTAATVEMFAALRPKPGGIGSRKVWGPDNIRDVRGRLKSLISKVREYGLFVEDLGEADRSAARQLAALARLAMEADAIYAQEKRRRGLLDFTDLLDCTERLLAGNDAVRAALGGQIDQLLIDECQDTNAFQLRLLGRLVDLPAGGGAPPDGRLFVVGDAQQSIYRFRGAQVEVFAGLCGRLGPDGQELLSTSFRTHDAGIAFINHLFGPLMGADYAAIEAHRKDAPPQASVEVLLAAGSEAEPLGSADAAAKAQAAATAERIRRMLDERERLVWDAEAGSWRPVACGDVAILLARMTKSLDYERELQRRGIPYYVVAGTGFFQQQEVFDVLNALAAVDNPADDVALFGALRSSLFGLDDNTLMHVAESCRPPYHAALPAAGLAERLGPERHEALHFAAELIGRLHARKDAVGIDELLAELLDETGYEATLLSQFQGRRMLGNVRRVVERGRIAAADGLSLADFIAQMQELVLSESRYEQAAVAGEYENVVRVMTIHKAKGLEFPVVILPDLNAGHRGPTGRCLIRSDWGPTVKLAAADGDAEEADEPLSYRLARRLEARAERREDLRKLYVAATRHQDHLILVGADLRTREDRFAPADSYLAQMDEVLEIRAALADGRCELPYADGRYAAALARVVPAPAAGSPAGQPAGQKLLRSADSAAGLARSIIQAAGPAGELPRVGPLPAETGQVEIAVTALNDFEKCPMLYRWRYELRVPAEPAPPAAEGAPRPGGSHLDAATIGTLYHRCMELLDFAAPQDAAALIRQAAGEMELDEHAELATLADELGRAMGRLRRHELWGRLASARQLFRELDFVMDCPPAVLRGQIDLLCQDPDGAWHVVDYKSDRVGPEAIEAHARGYELQLLVYAAAAGRHLGAPPAGAELYFLRPAATWSFQVTPDALGAVEGRAASLARELISARRGGRFARRQGRWCASCPYGSLCEGWGVDLGWVKASRGFGGRRQ